MNCQLNCHFAIENSDKNGIVPQQPLVFGQFEEELKSWMDYPKRKLDNARGAGHRPSPKHFAVI